MTAADIDLNDPGVVGIELRIGKVGAQHQQYVGLFDRLVPGREAQQASHADVVGVVVLDVLFAAECVHDRRLQGAGQAYQLIVRTGDTGATQDRNPLAGVQDVSRPS